MPPGEYEHMGHLKAATHSESEQTPGKLEQTLPFNTLDYGCKKFKRVVKSSLLVEIQAMAEALDQQMVV